MSAILHWTVSFIRVFVFFFNILSFLLPLYPKKLAAFLEHSRCSIKTNRMKKSRKAGEEGRAARFKSLLALKFISIGLIILSIFYLTSLKPCINDIFITTDPILNVLMGPQMI